jgi:ribonuclease G
MLVESDPHQSRVAVLEDDQLTELFVERVRGRGLVGNVFKGRVTRVLPGMQAAFVDIGLERDAFLYVSDVGDEPEIAAPEGSVGEGSGEAAERPVAAIDDLLEQGEELLVQVTKDPLPNKGARITAHVTLPGRYLVLLPGVRHLGVSRRIEDEAERQRLLEVIGSLDSPGSGMIVRTVGEGKGKPEFEADLAYLAQLWERIESRGGKVRAPTLLHQELDVTLRTVRDLFSGDFEILWVDGAETYERIVNFLDEVQPRLLDRVKLYQREHFLFRQFRIDEEMEAALRSKVWLKSGGYLVIHPTEALVAIDVNTGRFTGGQDLEDTVLKTNLEAIKEVVRQIRLRDLGGIIVLDLIDMVEEEHRQQVFSALELELAKDRAKHRVLNISEFGLVELTRKRTRPSLERLLTQPCPYCRGRGRVRSTATTCLNIRSSVLDMAANLRSGELLLRVHPDVARALQREEQAVLDELQVLLGGRLVVQSDSEMHVERFDVSEI